ncbi:unnamed protein product [Effrenium voratum]|nr:unnamed protein product [Effrenium voratum]
MPASTPEELNHKAVDALWRAALDVVKDNFNAAEHLPKQVYDFLLPISASTCQGMFSTVMMFAGAMPALSNGASVRLWNQKPSPLALMVLHMAPPQRGKSRLFQAVELLFETADDFVAKRAKEYADELAAKLVPPVEGAGTPELQVTTKSVSLQSFTMTEFFYRCSVEFPQVEVGEKKDKKAARVWYGQAFNLDECYEFLEQIGLLGARGDRSDKPSGPVNCHASTLNTLIQRGKTKRATRTSTSYENSRTQRIALSILGNGHPSKLISMGRGLEGGHTAATRERFLFAVDASIARHDSLPQDLLQADRESVVVRTEWRISGRWLVKDQTEHIYEGARRVCSHFEKRPHSILTVREDAQRLLLGNQVAQSIRAAGSEGSSLEALHANAAHAQGMLSAAVAILEMAGGGGKFDASGNLEITKDHVQVAARLVELNLQVREVLRGPMDAAAAATSDESDDDISKPVSVPCPPNSFAPPAATQAAPFQKDRGLDAEGPQLATDHAEHVPVDVPLADLQEDEELWQEAASGALPAQLPLKFSDLEAPAAFFAKGFGNNGSMLLASKDGLLKDRELLQKLLLLGRSEIKLPKVVDVYHVVKQVGDKRRKGGDTTVILRAWSSNVANQTQYHNEAMQCCRVSIREISKRRALWHDRQAGEQKLPESADGRCAQEPSSPLVEPRQPQPSTPPTGR